MKKLLITTLAILISASANAATNKGKVIATVNGENIYEYSVEAVYKTIPEDNIKSLGGKEKVTNAIINQLVSAEALKQEALKSGIEKNESFKEILKIERERLIQEEFLRQEVEKAITEKQIKEVYDEAVKEFSPEKEYLVFNILSKTEEDAKNIIKELESGADFSELAIKKSQTSNVKETKGSLGYIKSSDLIDNIAKEIKSIKEGEFSVAPVKSPFGWNVFHVKESRMEKAPTFEESKSTIRQSLYKEKMLEIVKELKNKAEVIYK
ncbi:MAG: peptidylprolyl isomerase [Alphaproteobacteria bacterium]|nr:peptidylprolyl isomerase [Alphaproteobacteria bacterium]